jgi:hypothetical protein
MTYEDWIHAVRGQFPKLSVANSRLTSPTDEGYNCIAWAAEDVDYWWEPDAMGLMYWPSGVPREYTLNAYAQAYSILGYLEPTDESLQPGSQKVAIYADAKGTPTHASRQLRDGWWASKLGRSFDIEHDFAALDGPLYGTVAMILAKAATPPRPPP